jgi:nucleotide-binding universal stress UspA family protein
MITETATPMYLTEAVEDYPRRAATVYLNRIEKLCRKNSLASKIVIRRGSPVEESLKEGKKSKADIIVMGSDGRSAVAAAILGSAAFGVVHQSRKIPVLIIR